MYTNPSAGFEMAMAASMYGFVPGWSIMVSTEDAPQFLFGEELNNLVIDATCVLD